MLDPRRADGAAAATGDHRPAVRAHGAIASATAQAAVRAGCLVLRGLRLAWRRPADAVISAAFFLLVAGLLALALAPLGQPPATVAAVAAWVGALLAALLAQQQGWREDAACGALDQLRLAPGGAVPAVAALVLAQVIATAFPLLLATPAVALFYGLSLDATAALALSVLIGLPAVAVLAAFASALTLGSRATPAALGLTLPLATPLLLFGVRAADPIDGSAARLLLLACSLLALAFGPWAVAAALTLEDEA